MSTLRIVAPSLWFHWRMHLAVALGVAAATTVLTGALLVGDSVRGTLRSLVLDRLGRIDELLVVDRFFRQELAQELDAQPKFTDHYSAAVPAILFPSGSVELAGETGRRRAGNVAVVASGPEFWKLGDAQFAQTKPPGKKEIVLNAPLADELGAKLGDQVTLHLGKASQLPADSPLGREDDLIASVAELKVVAIIPAESLGRFSLLPTQVTPLNAFVALETLQSDEGLDVPGKVNAIFVAGRSATKPPDEAASRQLASLLHPQLSDEGLTLKHVRQTFDEDGQEEVIFDYYSLSSERMLLDEATEREALAAFAGYKPQPVLTYLANMIEKVRPADSLEKNAKGIPYSTIAALDPSPSEPLIDVAGQPIPPLADDEIVLTSWAASDQGVQVGDKVRVTYFEPETIHGEEREASAEFRVAAIVPLTEPDVPFSRRKSAEYKTRRPTPANDPDLTPEVKGITDQASIADWDAPFPFDYNRIRGQDDNFWENHRTTPKAYVSLATGRRLWGSRFGRTTSIRIPAAEGVTAEKLADQFLAQLRADDVPLGLEFRPLKRQGLAASSGTTPFDVLFLALSMFIIAAALMLVWLLFRLGIEQRAGEIGTLLALGWTRRQTGWALLVEGGLVAAVGAAIGVAGGVAYAWVMIVGLRTWWSGAIEAPSLVLHLTPTSLIVGWTLGLAVSCLTIWFSLRGLRNVAVRRLMAGEVQPAAPWTKHSRPAFSWLRIGIFATLLVSASGLAVAATRLGGEAQAGAFLGAGAVVLVALLLVISGGLKVAGQQAAGSFGGGALPTLAVRNAARSASRSVTTIALMASAAFLIVSVSSFRLRPSDEGTGGFNLLAESAAPVIDDLGSPAVRKLRFAAGAEQLAETTVLPFRLQAGDDASCRNLYQPSQPRVLGVTPALVEYFDNPQPTVRFRFAASAARDAQERLNPWRLISGRTPADQPVPVVLDKNTAMFSLRLYRGVGEVFKVTYESGPTVRFKVAGLLENSVLQGSLLVSEADFTRLFPQTSGYRFFLIRAPVDKVGPVAALLEDKLGDEGFDTADARLRLAELLAVQNTYISTFQALGALGLVLGTFGLAAVQLRNVFERRKELALLRATGFRRLRLGEMVLLENLLLLVGGIATGAIAALVTVLPHMIFGGASVPLAELSLTLGAVLLVGVMVGLLAVRATLRAPLVAALRGE